MPSLAQTQHRFSAYIRDPERSPPPDDVAPRRMAMYRELFYNNVESFLSGNFPVLRSLHDDAAWHALAQDFFARHRCQTPYFYAIPEEFLAFLRDERGEKPADPPFIRELAHYEWAEMAVAIAQGEPPPPLVGAPSGNPLPTGQIGREPIWIHPQGSGQDGPLSEGRVRGSGKEALLLAAILEQPLALSDLAWPLVYRWPVHKIGPEFQPQEPPAEPTLLVICRNRADQVKFLEINPVTYRLLELLQAEAGKTGAEYLEQIATELSYLNPVAVFRGGAEIFGGLAERAVIGRAA